MGHRILLLAQSLGIPTSDPSEVIPLLMARSKAERESYITMVSGYAYVLASAFGKADMNEWVRSLLSPSERVQVEKARKEQDDILRNKAMLMKIQMMAEKYNIKEVRE